MYSLNWNLCREIRDVGERERKADESINRTAGAVKVTSYWVKNGEANMEMHCSVASHSIT